MALNQKLIKTYVSGIQTPISSAIASAFYLSGTANAASSSIINSTTTLISISSLLYTVPSGRIAKVMLAGGLSLAADMYLSLLVGASVTNTAVGTYGAVIVGAMQGAAQFNVGSLSAGLSSSIPVSVSVPAIATYSILNGGVAGFSAAARFGHAAMNFNHLFLTNIGSYAGTVSAVLGQSTQSATAGYSGYGAALEGLPVWLSGGPKNSGGGVAAGVSVSSSFNTVAWGTLSSTGANLFMTSTISTNISAWQQSSTTISSANYPTAVFYLSSGETVAFNYALSATVSGTFSGGSSSGTAYSFYPSRSVTEQILGYDSNGAYYYYATVTYGASSVSAGSLGTYRQSVVLSYSLNVSAGSNPSAVSAGQFFGAGFQLLVIEEAAT